MGEGRALVLFGRLPVEGRVKTRLAAGSSAAAACSFYRSCCEHLLRETGRVSGARRVFFCSEEAQRTPVMQWVCAIDPVRGQSKLHAQQCEAVLRLVQTEPWAPIASEAPNGVMHRSCVRLLSTCTLLTRREGCWQTLEVEGQVADPDLGTRMAAALQLMLDQGATKVSAQLCGPSQRGGVSPASTASGQYASTAPPLPDSDARRDWRDRR
jgi:hypothetical protein